MGTSLSGTKIKDTYDGLIKTSNNSSVGSSNVELTDGLGNDINISINNTGDLTADGDITAANLIKSGGTATQVLLANGTVLTLTLEASGIGSNDSDSNVPTNAAVKDYVDTEISDLIDGSPTALDTLNELAAALGDDANFSTTVTTALGNRLRIDVNNQGLTSTEKANAFANLDITAGTGISITGTTFSADIDTDSIQSDAVTAPKLAEFADDLSAAVAGHILVSDGTDFTNVAVSGDITITSAGVTTLGADTVDNANIVDGAIDTEHFTAGAVDNSALGADSVSGAKIADTSIDSEHYVAGSIDNEHLAANSVDSDNYVDGSIDEIHLNASNSPIDNYVLSYDQTSGGFTWVESSGGGATTIVTESFNGDNSTAVFDLANTIASEDNVQIYIDGVYQSKSNYSTSGNTITFSTAPNTGTNNIEVTHFVAIGGTPSVEVDTFNGDGTTGPFTLTTEPATKNNLQIYIDGVYQSKSNYSVSTTDLTFTDNTPTGTNNIEVTHIKLS